MNECKAEEECTYEDCSDKAEGQECWIADCYNKCLKTDVCVVWINMEGEWYGTACPDHDKTEEHENQMEELVNEALETKKLFGNTI